jgi:hypothetical protein
MAERFFNTAGPVRCEIHYCLPPLERFNLAEILTLIDQQKYFVLHAPRQTGKTSALLALMEYLNQEGKYRCLYANVETGQAARENVAEGIATVIQTIAMRARTMLGDATLELLTASVLAQTTPTLALEAFLTRWCEQSNHPIVLLIDEIDALIGDTLIAVLRQLRAGYDKRPSQFPQSIVLCGVRDVRDYRIHSSRDKAIITGGSAFNVKAESLRLGNFSQVEVEQLYQQHTQETGQQFEPVALELAWELTQGQPWLVNALAYEVCFKMERGRDRSNLITEDMMINAKERLILRRETHLDQLVDKLKEPRVQRVISPMLEGTELEGKVSQDDIQYVIDLGLVRHSPTGLQVTNPIYEEIIPRELNYVTQLNFESTIQPAWYIGPDGRLEIDKLLQAFQQFFREHSESWVERFDYKEAGPQLLLQAFLQRIINGGGRVEREYGLGRGRIDLLVIWPSPGGGEQRIVIELKLKRGSLSKTMTQGLEQTKIYMGRSRAEAGHLVIFDRDKKRSWVEKIFVREEEYQGTKIKVWGM